MNKHLINTGTPKSAQQAYNKLASFLHKNSQGINDPDTAFLKHQKVLSVLVGRYTPAIDMMIRVWYNVEDFVADGEPMDQVWADIEDMCN